MESALRARLSVLPSAALARNGLLLAAAEGLSTGARPEGVRAVAERVGASERHLRNLFTGDVGLSPKQFARIDRVLDVLARVAGR
ncbi:hypothetical protein [Spirillospora sp. NBC_01491]|uniref:hypothetical protein n=1 Tax=Spirillospora sp. NBC_01491 TaxID=2976007 RepID=UPI002E34C3ED|nr:hypothetical protein [Spirillospora sp. NBC_01491]